MDEQMMAVWLKYAEPGAAHRFLGELAGTWDTKALFWMKPDAPPTESVGTSVNELIMGGRFLRADYTASFMGQAFQGMALDGYDNIKQRYVGLWIDTMGTMMLNFEGEIDEQGKVRTMTAEYVDAVTGSPAKMKGVTTLVGKDEHRYQSWIPGPDGKPFKSMEVVYTRK